MTIYKKIFSVFLKSILILGIGSLITSCRPENSVCELSFYHWKSQLDIGKSEQLYLDSLNVKKLYLRFFDVDYDFNKKETKPLAPLSIKKKPSSHLEIVPTIFITNRTLLQLEEEELPILSNHIFEKINLLAKDLEGFPIHEIQIDCDWSERTKWRYFRLLTLFKNQIQQNGWQLSVTIRLHQIKFFNRTGVPPADRGILMFYNIGEVAEWETKNSILDLAIAQQYLVNFDQYPLALDLALPIFSWGVLFRDEKMIRLLNTINESKLSDTERFLKIEKNRYKIIKSTYLDGHYLYQEDLIRFEKITTTDLQKAIDLLDPYLKKENRHLVFYHLDSTTIKPFPYESLHKLGQKLSH